MKWNPLSAGVAPTQTQIAYAGFIVARRLSDATTGSIGVAFIFHRATNSLGQANHLRAAFTAFRVLRASTRPRHNQRLLQNYVLHRKLRFDSICFRHQRERKPATGEGKLDGIFCLTLYYTHKYGIMCVISCSFNRPSSVCTVAAPLALFLIPKSRLYLVFLLPKAETDHRQ